MARGKKATADAGPVEGLWELPAGWSWARLDEVAPVNPGRDLGGVEDNDEVTFLPMAAVAELSGKIDLSQQRLAGSVRSGFTRFRTGDVIFAKITPCMENGKLAVIPDIPLGVGAGSTEFHVLEPRQVSSKYLFYWLCQQTFRDRAERNMQGAAGQRRVPADWLRSSPVPIPPNSSVQQDVVESIDRLFAEIDEGEAALAEARAGVETYRKALLKAAVTGELTADWRRQNPPRETGTELLDRILAEHGSRWQADPKNDRKKHVEPAGPATDGLPTLPAGWTWASLPQLGEFGRGKSKHRPRNDPRLYGGAYPFIQTGIVADSYGSIERHDQTYSELGLSQSKLWPAGTICITIAANIAKTGVLRFDACFPDSIVGLSCADGVVPEYVELFIRTVREELDRWAPATAQKNINLETLYGVAVPIPPTDEQREIVRLTKDDDGIEPAVEGEDLTQLSSTLRQSILAAAFRGELTV